MKAGHAIESWLVRALFTGARSLAWQRSLGFGAALGDLAARLGIRRRVATENLRRAFPERSDAERDAILREHYRELGRTVAEYARLAELARAPAGEVVAGVAGIEHLLALRDRRRGAILLSGHFGNVEMLGAYLGRLHPVDFVVRPLGNPAVEAWIASERAAAGVGTIRSGPAVRRAYESLESGRWVAMLGDQDARRHGVPVKFLGTEASTALGPARLALATGAPIVMGFAVRQPDGRHLLTVEPPLETADPQAPGAALDLTRRHVARLEHWVRAHPQCWFWLHRRWKTRFAEAAP